jgi:hypothetical protein
LSDVRRGNEREKIKRREGTSVLTTAAAKVQDVDLQMLNMP